MPVLLSLEQSPSLNKLLKEANLVGLDYSFIDKGKSVSTFDNADNLAIAGIGSINNASEYEISFLSNPKFFTDLNASKAAAIIITAKAWADYVDEYGQNPAWIPVICEQPYVFYALIAQWFDKNRISNAASGVHPSAVIAEDAIIEDGVHIGPLTVIESGAHIQAGVHIGASCVIGSGSTIGKDSLLHAHVTIYHNVHIGARAILHSGVVLGADGFGFAPDPRTSGAWTKIAQHGRVIIGDDVEIGANTTVDRGAIEDTVLGNGVKLDNQIMIGHNSKIGDHTAMAACVGVAGSTTMGKRCVIGGAAMFGGHLTLADDVHISGGTAVTSDILEAGRYTGVFPLATHKAWQHNAAVINQLAQLRKRVRLTEKELAGKS